MTTRTRTQRQVGDALAITPAEAGVLLRCSRYTVYRLIKAGTLPAFRIGARLRISRTALEEWVLERARAETQERTTSS